MWKLTVVGCLYRVCWSTHAYGSTVGLYGETTTVLPYIGDPDMMYGGEIVVVWFGACISFAVRKDGELNMWGVPTDHHQVVAYKVLK